MPVVQVAHRGLGWIALVAVGLALFLVGLAAFAPPEERVTVRERAGAIDPRPAGTSSPRTTGAREPILDGDDAAVDRVTWSALFLLGVALAMLVLVLVAAADAPAAFLRLTATLAALSAVDAGLVLLRDVSTAVAALHVLAAATTLIVAARIVGRHALLPAPWRVVRT